MLRRWSRVTPRYLKEFVLRILTWPCGAAALVGCLFMYQVLGWNVCLPFIAGLLKWTILVLSVLISILAFSHQCWHVLIIFCSSNGHRDVRTRSRAVDRATNIAEVVEQLNRLG